MSENEPQIPQTPDVTADAAHAAGRESGEPAAPVAPAYVAPPYLAPPAPMVPPMGPPAEGYPAFGAEPVTPARPPRKYRGLLIGGVAAIALGIGASGVGIGTVLAGLHNSGNSSSIQGLNGSGSGSGGLGNGYGYGNPNGNGFGYGNGSGRPRLGRTSVNATPATAAQKVGVVTIVSTLDYNASTEAAGTGIIYTSGGEILTNNHVVQGSTAIKVTIQSTGMSYRAQVIGTDATDDIAVLQLVDANGNKVTGLTKAKFDTGALTTGLAVASIGNAEGTGNLVAASGTVTALNKSIQVANDSTGATENLSGLIETNADVVSGDSGGPLIDAAGGVTGVVTAASSGARNVTGYAIPINTALSIAKKIVAGEASSTITIGLPAFLGVELATAQASTGVAIAGAIPGSPAANTGLTAGDVITAVNGTPVTSTDSLSAAVKSHAVGDKVTITYTDASGASQQVAVTLTAGPAA
jgi:S1-C subfamily serine protease